MVHFLSDTTSALNLPENILRRMRTIAGYVTNEEFKASDFEKGEYRRALCF